ncbi:glycosyltransferase [Bradyrhizobium sp. JYMT SZCCT0428]|uniref:glycosyltransferase family 2 protein n=1 Tax=Bradyrhizobium sp. JYMT SZCCT0428 TaxID=2807673 RepID=UPI001BADB91E|nr:glycosyltransferase [Bradyrhizobium sp. JYMT SZCCT0428]MBR1151586.1 glycosyltransferase [Bradyrhizobium sp. JYMT SZCCT0428]
MRSSRVTISVIITNYNYEKFVSNAIDSVLRQTRPADEIIVIDDGSTDGSRDRIASYGNLITPVFQANEGIKAVSNTGFARSNGALVIYLDADDALYPAALELIERAYEPGTAKIQFDLDVVDSQLKSLGRKYCNFPKNTNAETTAREFAANGTYAWPVTSGNVYAREFLQKVMPLTPPVSHDGVLNTIAPLYGKIVTIAEPLGLYRLHLNNISRIDDSGRINIIPDFASRIHIRKLEFDMLADHARRLGYSLPDVDFLDRELVFVNYRLMARKSGREDGDDARRSLMNLCLTGVSLIIRGPYRFSTRVKHLVWLVSLALAPSPLARVMMEVRYNRNHLRSNFQSWIRRSRY